MSWQDVVIEKLKQPLAMQFCSDALKEGIQGMAEEIVRLRQENQSAKLFAEQANIHINEWTKDYEALEAQRDALIKDLAKSHAEVAELSKMNSDGCDLLGVEIGRFRTSEAKRAKLREALEKIVHGDEDTWKRYPNSEGTYSIYAEEAQEALAADAAEDA